MNPSSQSSIEQIATMVKEKLSLKPGFSMEEFRVITKTVGRQTRVKFELSLVSTPNGAHKHKSPSKRRYNQKRMQDFVRKKSSGNFSIAGNSGSQTISSPSGRAGRLDSSELQVPKSVRAVSAAQERASTSSHHAGSVRMPGPPVATKPVASSNRNRSRKDIDSKQGDSGQDADSDSRPVRSSSSLVALAGKAASQSTAKKPSPMDDDSESRSSSRSSHASDASSDHPRSTTLSKTSALKQANKDLSPTKSAALFDDTGWTVATSKKSKRRK